MKTSIISCLSQQYRNPSLDILIPTIKISLIISMRNFDFNFLPQKNFQILVNYHFFSQPFANKFFQIIKKTF